MNKHDSMAYTVRHALKMIVGTFASRVLGLIREMLTASFFGATRELDAFYVAFTLANLSRQLLAEGALSASFVPIFSRTLEKNGINEARNLAQQSLFVLLCCGVLVVSAGIIFAPFFVSIMAPGFDAVNRLLAISLTRAMFPFLIFVSVAALAMGVLNSNGSFFIPAVAPALSNLVYIVFLLATYHHVTVWNLVYAMLLGGFSQMMLQWYFCRKAELSLYPKYPRRDNKDLSNMMKLFFPYAVGLSLNQVNPVVNRMLGSFLEGGSISVLNYADRVLQLPLGLFVIALSQAVLPTLSKHNSEDTVFFKNFMKDALRLNCFVVIPVAVWMFLVSEEIIHILFFRGAFTVWAWHSTATALAIYSLGLPGMATSTLLLRGMYARRMPKSAVTVTAVTVIVNLIVSITLMRTMRYAGLATATATAFTIASVYGGYSLSKNIGTRLEVFNLKWCMKIFLSVLAMSFFVVLYKNFLPYPLLGNIFLKIRWILCVMFIGAMSYAVPTLLLRCNEWLWIKNAIDGKQ